MLAGTAQREERGAGPHGAAVERQVRDLEARVAARAGAEQVAERAGAPSERGHHRLTCACATTVGGGAGGASGGTASTRSAPETMFANTGAAMSPP